MQAVKDWMIKHLSDEELNRLEKRDPLWCFDSDEISGSPFFVEWGIRVKDGKFLQPVPGTNYRPKLTVLGNNES